MKRMLCLLFFTLILLMGFTSPVLANELALNQTVVHEGQKVGDFVTFGQDAVISGEVTDEVVVIDGNLTLTKTAWVRDRIFVIGGNLIKEPGARIDEGIVHIGTTDRIINSLLLGAGAFVGLEFGKLMLSLLTIIITIIFFFFARNKVQIAKQQIQDNMSKTAVLGFLAVIGLSLIMIALIVTLWGIPIALILSLIVLILLPIGLTGLSLVLGQIILSNSDYAQKPFIQALVGSFLVVALLNFPVLGAVWGVLTLFLAGGATVLSLVSSAGIRDDA